MSALSLLLLAVGLAMDATAVAAARGLSARRLHVRHALRVALLFGGAQALMPLFGWLLGARLGRWVSDWDHWIAFALLSALGGKMLWEARSAAEDDDEDDNGADPFAWKVLLVMALATSIDAFAVGVTLPMLEAPMLASLLTIGVVTAVLSAAGVYAGRHFGALLGKRLDVFGGLVLIGLGCKFLLQDLLG